MVRPSMRRLRAAASLTAAEERWLAIATGALFACSVLVLALIEDVVRHDGVQRGDRPWLEWVARNRGLRLEAVSRLLALVGDVRMLLAMAVLAGLVLWRLALPPAHCAAPLVALLGAGSTVAVLKLGVGRLRPQPPLRLFAAPASSFPSGHSADSTAVLVTFALVLAVTVLRRPLARVLVVAAAALSSGAIGASRLVLGVHWPTDVIAGLAIGLVAALGAVSVATLACPVRCRQASARQP